MGDIENAKLILVGRVAGGFGVRGEVRVTTYTEDPMALLRYRELKREDGVPALTLNSARVVKGGIIAGVKEVVTKEAADALRGLRLYVARETLPAPEDEDEFYLADLIGLAACTPEGEPLGRVKAVHDFGAGDILEIDPSGGQPTFYLPFTRDAVPDVSLSEGRLIALRPGDSDAEAPAAEADAK